MSHSPLRVFIVLCLGTFTYSTLALGQSPFEFVQEPPIRTEISVSDNQIARVVQLQPRCDALCQANTQTALGFLDGELGAQFEALSMEQQMQSIAALESDIRESIELDMLESEVLSPSQMLRFNQLWVQQSGVNALTTGRASRELGISDLQISQIQNIQTAADAAFQACVQDSRLSPQQQFVQIQNIQINMINQCVNCLSDPQVQQFLNMCGEPLEPVVDPPAANGIRSEQIANPITPTTGQTPIIGSPQNSPNVEIQNQERARVIRSR